MISVNFLFSLWDWGKWSFLIAQYPTKALRILLFINGTPSPALTAAPQIPTHHPVPLIFSQMANMLILAIILYMKLYGSFTLAKIVGKTVSERNIWQRHTKTHPGHIRHHDTDRTIGAFLFLLHRSRWPRKVQFCYFMLGHFVNLPLCNL